VIPISLLIYILCERFSAQAGRSSMKRLKFLSPESLFQLFLTNLPIRTLLHGEILGLGRWSDWSSARLVADCRSPFAALGYDPKEKNYAYLENEEGVERGPVILGKELVKVLNTGDVMNVCIGRYAIFFLAVMSSSFRSYVFVVKTL